MMTPRHYVIVVAEDNAIVNQLLTGLLEDQGYSVVSCFNGAEAYRLSARLKPDLVITDLQMEVDDAGLLLLRRLREDPATVKIGVIICSANKTALSHHHSLAATLEAKVVQKPYDVDHLLATVAQLLAESL
jgi:CheY-like chemotaxis protein